MKTRNFLLFTSASLLLIMVAESMAQAAERFSVQAWKSSLAQAVEKNDSKKILDLVNFDKLEAQAVPACVDCDAKKKMTEARQLFAKGDMAGAEKLYNQIPKGSDLWLEAVQERGWAYFRADDTEKALAQTKTLLSPQFAGIVQTESYFLQSLTELKNCDYAGVLETDRDFKANQKSRIVEMKALAKTGMNDILQKAIVRTDKFPLEFADFGEDLTHLPLAFYRDTEFQTALLKFKISQAALDVMPPDRFTKVQKSFLKLNTDSFNRLQNRMATLAAQENAENFKIVQKLNLVEVEAIQRIHTDMEMAKTMYKTNDFKKVGDDKLVFMDDGHPWIDELDKYEVAGKVCGKNVRRKM